MKKIKVNCTSVLLILLFTSYYVFQWKRKEWDCWWVLLLVFKWTFQKNQGVFMVGSNYINPKDTYGRLIDFVSQISKLSYFMHGLVDFVMHLKFVVLFF